jgi:hypothetical protein
MHTRRHEITMALAHHLSARVRDWAEDYLPENFSLRVVVREQDDHVETTIRKYDEWTRRYSHCMFVFPAAADDEFIGKVMSGMVGQLSSKS